MNLSGAEPATSRLQAKKRLRIISAFRHMKWRETFWSALPTRACAIWLFLSQLLPNTCKLSAYF